MMLLSYLITDIFAARTMLRIIDHIQWNYR